jgi:two-component system chemotaxis sensor kinase CheA
MSLSAKIREQLISGFRAELAEHVQTMNDGLLALEQNRVTGEQRRTMLEDVFRAAHSLKGAARAVGVTAVEQLAHALEDVLAAMQHDATELTPALFTACYRACDAIQAVQAAYEAGELTPPAQALQSLVDLEPFRQYRKAGRKADSAEPAKTIPAEAAPAKSSVPEAATPAPVPVQVAANSSDDEQLAPVAASADSQSAGAVVSPALGGDETIRVSVSKLDALMAQLSELLVTKIRAEQRIAHVRQAQEFVAQWQKDWFAIRSGYSRLARHIHDLTAIVSVDMQVASVQRQHGPADPSVQVKRALLGDGRLEKELLRLVDYVDSSQDRLREMNALVNRLLREYDNDAMHTALVIDTLEQEIKRVRMLPLTTITGTFGRMVRDLAQAAGKEAVLEIAGGEVELDKRVLEQIKDPLIHMLRNAIDHGIESPDKRQAAGKPRCGRITLQAEQLGQDVLISISDDGAGLDIETIRRVAMRQGTSSMDVQALSEAELAELIFAAGFTTSPIITDVSGRGVGLDVVRRNVEALDGHVGVTWKPGLGSTFALTLPLTLTSSRGLLVRISNQLFAIPLSSIERILHVSPKQIESLGGHDTVRYDGHPVALVRLDDVLELPHVAVPKDEQDDGHIPVIILVVAERRMAFAVDALAGEQEVVVKGMGRQLSRVGGIAGATVMGNGEVMLVLNAADLMKLAMRSERRSVLAAAAETGAAEAKRKARILVVDDSVTTRTLEKNILEVAGYSVQIATDGQEALNVIATTSVPDLIISDIFMPRVDGFDLTKRLKGDPRTANVPIVLVTSLDSTEDKARGIEAGADAYIVKSSFDQINLLETIEQLI